MRAFLLSLSLLILTSPCALAQEANVKDSLPPAPANKAWKLIWHDEFNGTVLDAKKWDVPECPRRDGYWSRKAIALDGKGHLVMSTLKDGDKFLDGCVRTLGKFEHSFGYYVARIQLQKQPGHWPAFWIMGPGVVKVGNEGRDGTEIDIMEKPWLDERVTLRPPLGRLRQRSQVGGHGGEGARASCRAGTPSASGGRPTSTCSMSTAGNVAHDAGGVCQVPEYIKLSDEIGGWGGRYQAGQAARRVPGGLREGVRFGTATKGCARAR